MSFGNVLPVDTAYCLSKVPPWKPQISQRSLLFAFTNFFNVELRQQMKFHSFVCLCVLVPFSVLDLYYVCWQVHMSPMVPVLMAPIGMCDVGHKIFVEVISSL
jgi:hypothetical protein